LEHEIILEGQRQRKKSDSDSLRPVTNSAIAGVTRGATFVIGLT
jgi:hypothetical protein